MTERTRQAIQQSPPIDYTQYVVIAISVCQLIGLVWVGAGKLGTLITDQLATHTTVTDISKQVADIKAQVAEIKSQQDTDRKDVNAKLETFQYDIRDILVALAAKQIFTPNDNTRLGGMPATRDDNPNSNTNCHRDREGTRQ